MSNSDYPRAWRFHSDNDDADGPVFRGRFTGVIEMGQTQSYGDKPVARFIQEETGEEVSIWLFHKALTEKLSKLRPEKDELIEITWKGKKKSKGGHPYHVFSVTAPERPVVAVSWDDLGTPDEEEEE